MPDDDPRMTSPPSHHRRRPDLASTRRSDGCGQDKASAKFNRSMCE